MLRFLILAAVLTAPPFEEDNDKIADRFWESTKVLEEMSNAPDGGVSEDLLQRAECVLVIPGMKQAAFGLGVRYGRGVAVCRRDDGFWGAPSMLTLSGGSFGFQLGGQETDVLLVVTNRDGIEPLLSDQLTLGADASATAGPEGRGIGAETGATMRTGLVTYARSRGLFAGVSLEGTIIKPDHEANETLYGQRVDPYSVLSSTDVMVPGLASRFVDTLNRLAWRAPGVRGED
jgi:SH3 domain-containing YSC84-like protein 1